MAAPAIFPISITGNAHNLVATDAVGIVTGIAWTADGATWSVQHIGADNTPTVDSREAAIRALSTPAAPGTAAA